LSNRIQKAFQVSGLDRLEVVGGGLALEVASHLKSEVFIDCFWKNNQSFLGQSHFSPKTMFTKQYSIRAMKTKTVQTDMNASTAFKYETGGKLA
jgi:hypothetical protein